jgi:hypothetical protein
MPAIIFLLVMLLVTPCHGFSAAIQAVVGSSAAASLSCTTSDDSKIWNPVTQPGTSADTSTWTAVKIVLSATTRITAYKVRQYDQGSDTGSATTSLYPHDTLNDKPDSTAGEITGSAKNVLMSAIPASSTVIDFDLATPKEVSAGTYWIVNREVDSANRNSYYVSSTGDRTCYSANGSTWTCSDNYMYDMELWGCQ